MIRSMIVLAPCLAVSLGAFADAAGNTKYADHFFEEGDDYRAVTFYKLALVDGVTDEEERARIVMRIVKATERGGHPDEAAAEASLLGPTLADRFRPLAQLVAGEAYLLSKQPGFAEDSLDAARATLTDPAAKKRATLLYGFALSEQLRFVDAAAAFGDFDPIAAAAALRHRDGIPQKSQFIAAVLSLVPGLGQLYAGAYQEAGLSFLINVLLGVITVDAWVHATRTDFVGAVTWTAIFGTFYGGNVYSAGLAAKRANELAASDARREVGEPLFAPLFGVPAPPDYFAPR